MKELVESPMIKSGRDLIEPSTDIKRDGFAKISASRSRLSDVLQCALSEHSDGVCSVADYVNTTPAIQRVLINCLQDDIDDNLFASCKNTSKCKLFIEDCHSTDSGMTKVDSDVVINQNMETSPTNIVLTGKLYMAAISKNQEIKTLTSEQAYLKCCSMINGFTEEDVMKTLQNNDKSTRPSDFIDIQVNSMHNSVNVSELDDSDDDIIITDIIDLTDEAKNTKVLNVATPKTCQYVDLVTPKSSDHYRLSPLPDGYKKRLIQQDIIAEDNTCSKKSSIETPKTCQCVDLVTPKTSDHYKLSPLPDGYKKRLIQNINTEDNTCSKKSSIETPKTCQYVDLVTPKTSDHYKLSPLPDGYKKRLIQNINTEDNACSKKSSVETPETCQYVDLVTPKTSDHYELYNKQLKLDSEANRTYSNDQEKTCVLKIWNADKISRNDVCIVNHKDHIQTTPKRKQYKGNQKCSEQIAFTDDQQNQYEHYKYQGPIQLAQPMINSNPYLKRDGCFTKSTQVLIPVTKNCVDKQLPTLNDSSQLRYIVIDGSNVAMSHGNGKFFSCKGIRICVDYFKQHGHNKITVFVPHWRQCHPSGENTIIDQHILTELKQEGILVFTPSRRIGGRLVAAYDDRFVLELAEMEDGIIVSNDQFRDLMYEKAAWRRIIEQRLLMYSFVKDRFMPPNDPLGRNGPVLADFLRC